MRRFFFGLLLFAAGCAATTNAGSLTSSTPPAGTILPAGTASASPAATVTPQGTKSARPSPTPTYKGSRTLTESDSGATIHLKIGEVVTISLPANYDPPQAQNDVATRVSSSGGYPTNQPVEATFRASKTGQADITTSTDYACLHAHPACMVAQRLWLVHVVVS